MLVKVKNILYEHASKKPMHLINISIYAIGMSINKISKSQKEVIIWKIAIATSLADVLYIFQKMCKEKY